jgi:hypothetical protein
MSYFSINAFIFSWSLASAISNGHDASSSSDGLVLLPTAITISFPYSFLRAGTNSDQICPVAPVTKIFVIVYGK